MSRKNFNTPEYTKRKRMRNILSVSIFIVLFSALIYLVNIPYFKVKSIAVVGQQTITTRHLEESINEYLDEYWFWVIPKRNILFVIPRKLDERLKKEFSKIYKVDIDVDVDTLRVGIEERTPHSLWCTNKEYTSKFNQDCMFSDQRGLLYARAPYFSDNVFLKIFVPKRVKQGERYLKPKAFESLFSFLDELEKEKNISLQSVVFLEHSDLELYINRIGDTVFQEKPSIRMNMDTSYVQLKRNINVVLEQPDFIEKFSVNPQGLVSIDLRFDDRAFYQYR